MSVGEIYTIPQHIAGYSAELYKNRAEFGEIVSSTSLGPEAQEYLANYSQHLPAGVALLCRQIYDIAHPGDDAHPAHRRRVGEIGALITVLTDIVDDEIDSADKPLEERLGYLDEAAAIVIDGTSLGLQPENKPQRVARELGMHLNETIIATDEEGLFRSLFAKLLPEIKLQLTSTSLAEHLQLAPDIGASCGMIGSVAVELVDADIRPKVHRAASGVGAYAECLDHAYEISDDLVEGAVTYPTLYLGQFGDTAANRAKVRKDLLKLGSESFAEGLVGLDARQASIYKSVARMVDLRYRVLKRMTNMHTDLRARRSGGAARSSLARESR